jgi:hypothetical protein
MVAVQEGQVDLLLVSRANPARPAGRRVSAACTRLPRAVARSPPETCHPTLRAGKRHRTAVPAAWITSRRFATRK